MNTYPGQELMSHPELNVDLTITGPLIRPELLKQMEMEYLKIIEKNYEDWLNNALTTEKQGWKKDSQPEHDQHEKYYHTSAPVIIFQMIDQNLQVTNTIHSDLTFNALILSIQQVAKYGFNYRQEIIIFKDRHFKDRSLVNTYFIICCSTKFI